MCHDTYLTNSIVTMFGDRLYTPLTQHIRPDYYLGLFLIVFGFLEMLLFNNTTKFKGSLTSFSYVITYRIRKNFKGNPF